MEKVIVKIVRENDKIELPKYETHLELQEWILELISLNQ